MGIGLINRLTRHFPDAAPCLALVGGFQRPLDLLTVVIQVLKIQRDAVLNAAVPREL